MTSNRSRSRAVLLAALVVVSMVATTGAAAALSLDSGGTTWTAGTTATYNASQNETFRVSTSSRANETKVELKKNGSSYIVASNAQGEFVSYNASGADMTLRDHTIAHTALADTEHAAGANVTMDVVAYNNTSAVDPATSTTQHYIEFDNSSTVEVISDADVDSGDIVTVTSDVISVAGFNTTLGPFHADKTTIETNERDVNGSQTDVVVVLGNSSVVEDFDAAVSSASGGDKLSSLFSNTRTVALATTGDGTTVVLPVYYQEAPDSVTEGDSYAVYGTVGGSDALTVELGDEFEDADSVSVESVGGAGAVTWATKYLTAGIPNLMG